MVPADLWENANSVRLETADTEPPGVWGICVGASDDLSADDIALAMPYRGRWMRRCVLGALREEGFDVVMLDDPPHAVLLLNDEPSGDDWSGWVTLDVLFEPEEPNPAWEG